MDKAQRSLLLAIRESGDFKKLKEVQKKTEGQMNLERDRAEALGLHAGRTSRKLYGDKQYSNKALIDAALRDLSARARLVELRVLASKRAAFLEVAVDAMRVHINTAYKSEMAEYRTVEQRKFITDRVLRQPLAILGDVEDFTDMLDHLIKDIDQAGYSLKLFGDALNRLDGAKGKTL